MPYKDPEQRKAYFKRRHSLPEILAKKRAYAKAHPENSQRWLAKPGNRDKQRAANRRSMVGWREKNQERAKMYTVTHNYEEITE
jgi:hypothetical protein